MQEECFCFMSNRIIIVYIKGGLVPDSALKRECCWSRINKLRRSSLELKK